MIAKPKIGMRVVVVTYDANKHGKIAGFRMRTSKTGLATIKVEFDDGTWDWCTNNWMETEGDKP